MLSINIKKINAKTPSVFKKLLFRMDNKQIPKKLCMKQCIIQKHLDRHEEHAEREEQEGIYQKERGG